MKVRRAHFIIQSADGRTEGGNLLMVSTDVCMHTSGFSKPPAKKNHWGESCGVWPASYAIYFLYHYVFYFSPVHLWAINVSVHSSGEKVCSNLASRVDTSKARWTVPYSSPYSKHTRCVRGDVWVHKRLKGVRSVEWDEHRDRLNRKLKLSMQEPNSPRQIAQEQCQ